MTTRSASLTAHRRARELAELADGHAVDVLVVGGGITGVGVALDAASRGLDVALVERDDLASGTSGMSSKLVHGGLRYLRHLEVGLALESARERELLMQVIAPHLVEPVPFTVAVDADLSAWAKTVLQAGIWAGEGLRAAGGGVGGELPQGRRVDPREAALLMPGLRTDGLASGPLWWEGRLEDDARLVVAVARTAAAHGVRILAYCDAEEVHADGAQVRDRLDGASLTVRARHVVTCAGVWADRLAPDVELQPSVGVHLVVAAERLGHPRAALSVPVPDTLGRFVFAVPRPDDTVLVGVTDRTLDGPVPESPSAEDRDVRFLLRTINQALRDPLDVSDVLATFAGLRPLLRGEGDATADLSRRHRIHVDRDGVLHVLGGKLTTYRRMAQEAVDHLTARPGLHLPPSRTHRLPLIGAADRPVLRRLQAPARLVRRYGTEADRVAAMAGSDPRLADTVVDGDPTLGVELAFGIRHEGAMTVADLLDRRTRLGLVPQRRREAEPLAKHLLADCPTGSAEPAA